MLMNEINCILDVYRFETRDDSNTMSMVTNDNKFLITQHDGAIIAETPLDYKGEVYSNNTLKWTNSNLDGKTTLFEDNEFAKKDYHLISYSAEEAGACYIDETEKYHGRKINKNGEILWKREESIFFQFHTITHYFYRRHPNQLTALNNQTGEELWTYTLPKEYDFHQRGMIDPEKLDAHIDGIVGIYHNIIWLNLSSSSLIGLSIETGELVKYIVKPDTFAEGFSFNENIALDKHSIMRLPNNGVFGYLQLDTKKGIISSVGGSTYAEVDLNKENYPCTLWDISETVRAQPSKSGVFLFGRVAGYDGDTVYSYDTGNSQVFGAFDRKTKKILWSNIFEDNGKGNGFPGIRTMKYANGYLYIHADSDESLHIFKLESK